MNDNPSKDRSLVPIERIERLILLIRSHKVILDVDLAALYGVETKQLVRAVKRNLSRFPDDFMFQLNKEEFENLRFHFGTSNQWGGRRYPPFAFTEQGVAMLSSILRSKRAIQVNIEIMRAFVRLRKLLASHADLARKLDTLEKKYDAQFKIVFDAIRELMRPPESKKRPIGFLVEEGKVPSERQSGYNSPLTIYLQKSNRTCSKLSCELNEAVGREVTGGDGSYELRESEVSWEANFQAENGDLSQENAFFWDESI